MTDDRWSQRLAGLHPDAIARAKDLENEGYTQHGIDELKDREGVLLVAGHSGAVAPGRYHRLGKPDERGARKRDVIESWPESPWANRLPYSDCLAGGDPAQARLGFFRLNSPDHERHVAALYDRRASRHRTEAQA
jgi:hypothetical protein